MRLEHWIYTIPLRLRSIFRRARVEHELDEELRFHLEQRIQREIAAGKTAAEARHAAFRGMEGMEQQKQQCRDARNVNVIENFAHDVRYAWRSLLKNLGFSFLAVLTLALGIGANSAIFSVINAALLRPLPYPHPNQLVLLFEKDVLEQGGGPNVVSFPNFLDWERESHSFVAMAAGRQNSFNLGGAGRFSPERIEGAVFSWALFKTLAVQPVIGRGFTPADDRPGAHRVAIIGYGLWQRRFGGARDVLHRQIRLDGVNCDIIGVMPQGFGYPARKVEVWTPVQQIMNADELHNRSAHEFYVVARMRDGVRIGQATAEVNGIQQRIWTDYQGGLLGRGAVSLPLRDITTYESKTSLYVLLGAVACLLLIACVNISNLLLARGSHRMREFSIRAALGASRSRLLQQLLTESVLIACMGAVAGLLLAYGLTAALGAHAAALIQADDINTSAPIRIDGLVLVFTACVSILAGLGAGLMPARRSTRGNVVRSLKEGGRTATSGRAQQRLRSGLVSAEVALSLVLLVAAGLMIRSFAELQRVRPGVRIQNLLTAGISLPDSRYSKREQVSHFAQVLLARLQALPGVRSVGLVSCLPVAGYCGDNSFTIEGHPLPPGQFYLALNRAASPDYFRTAGIPVLHGRMFTARDGQGFDEKHPHESAVIISESMARKFWPNGNALGQRIYFGDEHAPAGSDKSPRYSIVGIVGDVLIQLDDHPRPTMYLPLLEGGRSDFYAVLYTAEYPSSMVSSVRRAISGLDPDIPAFKIRTMAEIIGQSTEHRAFTAVLLGSFAGLALLLSAVGLYGVLSYLIAQRTAEIGIRMALGASRGEVCRLAVAQGLRPTFLGLFIGLIAAAALTRTMHGLLFGVRPTDVATFASVPLVLLLVALVACVIPVWRAARVDPAQAVRSE
jgi:predicted permease